MPVEPEVKITQQSSSGVGLRSSARSRGPRSVRASITRPAVITPVTAASEKTVRARSSGSSTSTGTYAAPSIIVPRIAT
ncbi:Uncharacterised protein [Mycobacteroides abscessus subsp. abscessus]|nr:Uncharacterised protein [Mycobacteroides abscessus subsp. abscessus]